MPPAARNTIQLSAAGLSLIAGYVFLAAGSGLASTIYYDPQGHLYLLLFAVAAHQVTAAILTAIAPRPPRNRRQHPRNRDSERSPRQT